jgi:hypothetical protein
VTIRIGTPTPLPPMERAWIADRARAAVRGFDPFVQTIDVAVVDAEAGGLR